MKEKLKAVTFSFPIELHHELRSLVGSQKMSQFVAEAVREKLASEKKKLAYAYASAKKEEEKYGVFDQWANIQVGSEDTAGECVHG